MQPGIRGLMRQVEDLWNQRGLSQEKILKDRVPTSLWEKFLPVVLKTLKSST